NMVKLLNNLSNNTNRNAQFKTVIALSLNNKTQTFTGICKGKITLEKQGNKGFGYDPIFKPDGYKNTFAEMDLATKNQISHRGKAINLLVDFLSTLK
ncbi:non-canonical purine NTP pyrophosphatase, partial [Seonamhaeicola marinus]